MKITILVGTKHVRIRNNKDTSRNARSKKKKKKKKWQHCIYTKIHITDKKIRSLVVAIMLK